MTRLTAQRCICRVKNGPFPVGINILRLEDPSQLLLHLDKDEFLNVRGESERKEAVFLPIDSVRADLSTMLIVTPPTEGMRPTLLSVKLFLV